MEVNDGINQLNQLCKDKDWFYDIGFDQYGRYAVYVKYMNMETMTFIPPVVGGKQVVVHFAASKTASRDQFVDDKSAPMSYLKDKIIELKELPTIEDKEDEENLCYLISSLDKLEKQCGSFTLQEIFYEIHDGKNAVTNMSDRFPDVRKQLETLYNIYGFDVIYNEMDG